MNRQQRRAAARAQAKKKEIPNTTYRGMALPPVAQVQKTEDEIETEYANVFMYTVGLIIKVLHEQWGWGYVRLSRMVNQLLEEYNNNDMDVEELQRWCWEYGGFKLQIEDEAK